MHFSSILYSLIAVAATTIEGKAVQVTIGADRKLLYSPNNITAAVSTEIEFSFFLKVCDLPGQGIRLG